MFGMLGMREFTIIGGVLSLGLAGTVFWVWMLIDCVTKEPSTTDNRLAWTLVIALTHLIGALAYLFVRRPERIRLYGQ
ncbi:MAG: PLDc_N domain-containing protein [Thermoanaerobaculaceae bacterium]|nr:PLDc_N domain-containing protein [Thermoanaerobaculaceae bacterium]MDI9621394.1 PLD nuclease N-terminal domain-containing protein [Acidobacteriota bacterium]NLH10999.1 PLDc_N domain-containing protein [Holophagae bacterium]HPW55435.1 PLD nuclease N-terminal domain-containing protein [Thermoanaerobaculaceae bacterium]